MPNTTPVVPGVKDTDPSALTREMILHEVMSLREIIETRLDGMDKAISLLQTYPTEVDRKVGQLKELTEEKFKSVDSRFVSGQTALDAALANTKEASAKVESNFTKQIDAIGARIDSEKSATEGRIADIKDRLTIIESVKKGGTETWAIVVGIIAVAMILLGGVGVVVGMIAAG